MPAKKKRTPYERIKSYAAVGDELMASRVYAEERVSFPRYMKALSEGRKEKKEWEARDA